MKNKVLSLIPLLAVIIFAFFLYQNALTQANYEGLPTVPCLDYTKPVLQDYSLKVSVSILGKPYLIPKNLGHDYGQCLHDIFVNDSTGTVLVKTNDQESFDLGNLFDIWHKTFNDNQIFSYQTTNGHTLEVFMNGKKVKSGRETPLFPDTNIEVIYK